MKQPLDLNFTVYVNPKRLSANKKGHNPNYIPPDVVAAQKIVTKAAAEARDETGWEPENDTIIYVDRMDVWFDDYRADLDNTVKRTLDAICEGLGFKDDRVEEIHLYKHVGRPDRIEVILRKAGRLREGLQTQQSKAIPVWKGGR